VTELWNKHNFTPIVNWRGAYQMWKANPVAVACTLTYSLMMPEAQIGVITPNGYDFESPIVGMLTRNQWRVTFGEIMTILCIGGNAYGYKLRNASGAIIGMRWYSDKNFAPVNDGYGDVEHYLYYDGQVAYTVRKEDVVHIQGFWYDPEKTLGGGSPVELAAQSIEGYNEATSTVFNIHKNDAMPKTLLVYDEELSSEQASLAQKSFSRKYGGEQRGYRLGS
jgi:phage portal protein BeeE